MTISTWGATLRSTRRRKLPPYPELDYKGLDGRHAYALLKAAERIKSGDYLCYELEAHASRCGGPVGRAAVEMRDALRNAIVISAMRQGLAYGTYGLEDLPSFKPYTEREMLEHRRLWARRIIDQIAGRALVNAV